MKTKFARLLIASLVLMGYTVAVSGADWTTETVIEEAVYQSLHAIDAAQTVQIAKDPAHYYEKESAWAIGAHPSEGAVIKYMATEAVIHAAVTATLVKLDAPTWALRTWELITIGDTVNCVRGNFKIGLRAKF